MRQMGFILLLIAGWIYIIIAMAAVDEFLESKRRLPKLSEFFYYLNALGGKERRRSWRAILITAHILFGLSALLFYLYYASNPESDLVGFRLHRKDLPKILIVFCLIVEYVVYLIKRKSELDYHGMQEIVPRNLYKTISIPYRYIHSRRLRTAVIMADIFLMIVIVLILIFPFINA